MSYIDLLDSAKTAYPNQLATEWWRKSSPEIQTNTISLAKTELMLRILHGETILLSNNQAFDSVAFLDSVSELVSLDFLERPPVALVYYKPKQPGVSIPAKWTPNVLVDLSDDYLKKKTFVFSAWIGMDDNTAIRTRMSNGLKNSEDDTRRFVSMVEDVYFDIDITIRDIYWKHAHDLQNFFNYLNTHYRLGKSVVRSTESSDKTIWKDLYDLRFSPSKGIPLDAIKRLDEDVIAKQLDASREDRSVLYRLIENYGSPLRENLRKYIDIYYNQKIGASVSPSGRGTYSVTDHNPNTPSYLEEQILENAETVNGSDGIVGEEALEVLPSNAPSISALTWDDVAKVLREEKKLRSSAYYLQDQLMLYKRLDRLDPDFARNLDEWRKKTDETFEKHETLLASLLGSKIKYDSTTRRMFLFTAPQIGSAGGAFIGTLVGLLFQNTLLGIAAAAATTEVLTNTLSSVFEKSAKKDLETSAITRVREDLRKSVKLPNK